jgi:MscS family membrane protein
MAWTGWDYHGLRDRNSDMKRNHLTGLAVVVFGLILLAILPPGAAQSLPGMPSAGRPAEEQPPEAVRATAENAESTSLVERLDLHGLYEDNEPVNWLWPLGGLLAGLIVGQIAAWVLRWLGHRLRTRGWHSQRRVVAGLAGPVALALLAFGLQVGLANLVMSDVLKSFLAKSIQLAYAVAVIWYLANLVTVVEAGIRRLRGKSQTALDRQLVPMVGKTLRVVVITLGVLFVAQTVFDQNVGAWLTGLGIVGLGVSLAAQDSIKNFFGSMTILLDQPFAIGERIQYAGYDGVVEEIGFRSTKVRTLAGNLVTIPNAKISSEAIENIARRLTIRRIINVTITYDTPRAKIEEGVEILRRILAEDGIREPIHPVIKGDELFPRVYFNDYNAESLNIFVIYWYAPPAWWDYMEHCQKLNLRIFEEFEAAGIEFAFPTQTLFLAGDAKRRLAIEMLGKQSAEGRAE